MSILTTGQNLSHAQDIQGQFLDAPHWLKFGLKFQHFPKKIWQTKSDFHLELRFPTWGSRISRGVSNFHYFKIYNKISCENDIKCLRSSLRDTSVFFFLLWGKRTKPRWNRWFRAVYEKKFRLHFFGVFHFIINQSET